MKVLTATTHFFDSIRRLFPDSTVELIPDNLSGVKADLLVFAGGSDINPKLYGEQHAGIYDDSRDAREIQIFHSVFDGTMEVNKVLGICRGLQLINVALGGTLFYDIATAFGQSHAGVHKIGHRRPHLFKFFESVNSLHHQACSRIGASALHPYRVLSAHTKDNTPEIVAWGNKMLGVQFHPEFFPDEKDEKIKFTESINKWVSGEVDLHGRPYKEGDESFERIDESVMTAATSFRNLGRVAWSTVSDSTGAFSVEESLERDAAERNRILEELLEMEESE